MSRGETASHAGGPTTVRPVAWAGHKIGAYVRVSSKSQDFPTQKHAIERCAAARGDGIQYTFHEKLSAKTTARPELEELRRIAREGGLVRLYVFRLDRLARSGIRDTLEVVQELQAHGCEVVSVSDGFDLRGPAAEIVMAVLAWAAQMELLASRERRAAARLRIEAAGGRWGRPPRMTKLEIERARRMIGQGKTIRRVSMAMKVPRSTLARSLAR